MTWSPESRGGLVDAVAEDCGFKHRIPPLTILKIHVRKSKKNVKEGLLTE